MSSLGGKKQKGGAAAAHFPNGPGPRTMMEEPDISPGTWTSGGNNSESENGWNTDDDDSSPPTLTSDDGPYPIVSGVQYKTMPVLIQQIPIPLARRNLSLAQDLPGLAKKSEAERIPRQSQRAKRAVGKSSISEPKKQGKGNNSANQPDLNPRPVAKQGKSVGFESHTKKRRNNRRIMTISSKTSPVSCSPRGIKRKVQTDFDLDESLDFLDMPRSASGVYSTQIPSTPKKVKSSLLRCVQPQATSKKDVTSPQKKKVVKKIFPLEKKRSEKRKEASKQKAYTPKTSSEDPQLGGTSKVVSPLFGEGGKSEEDFECAVCGTAGEDIIISCDICPRIFHLNCHMPVVDEIPVEWQCNFCKTKEEALAEVVPSSPETRTKGEVDVENYLLKDADE